MRELFGTDGIRGVAGEYPLDRATVFAIGRALGMRLKRRLDAPKVVIGQDTRESSAWISETLAQGLLSAGADFASAGVIPTPGVAYLTRTHGFAAGIVVSASHNPWRDNGIKLFGSNGMKLADALEHEIEQDIFAHIEQSADMSSLPKVEVLPGDSKLRQDYVNWLASQIDVSVVKKMRIVADCANGAATPIAENLFKLIGADADLVHVNPTGRNINEHCGALHPEHVAGEIAKKAGQYALGVTFDGDADRALFSDEHGNVVNGDAVMLIAGREMKQSGKLKANTLVATTMSNMGLEKALRESGIEMLRANVGDKYVLEEMQKTGATLGGEQSGHILFMDGDATTGDGLLTALRVMEIVGRTKSSLHQLAKDFKVFPQVIRNVKVREKVPMKELPAVAAAIGEAESELHGNGRVLVRYSGTEKLARIMIEAENESLMEKHVERISAALKEAIGL